MVEQNDLRTGFRDLSLFTIQRDLRLHDQACAQLGAEHRTKEAAAVRFRLFVKRFREKALLGWKEMPELDVHVM